MSVVVTVWKWKIRGYLWEGEKGLNILKIRVGQAWGVDQKERGIEGVAFTFALFATSLPLAAPLRKHRHVYIQRRDSDHSTPLVFFLRYCIFFFSQNARNFLATTFCSPFFFFSHSHSWVDKPKTWMRKMSH